MANARRELTPLEIELLEYLSMSGEPTTVLDEEMLETSPGRTAVEAALRNLLARGFVQTSRRVNSGGRPRRSDGVRTYEDDWWDLTDLGRDARG